MPEFVDAADVLTDTFASELLREDATDAEGPVVEMARRASDNERTSL